MAINGRDVSFWPAPLRRAVDSIAVMLMQVYMIARGRAAASASPVVRTLAERDEEAWKLAIVRAGIQLSRSSVQRILREKKPEAPATSKPVSIKAPAVDVKPHHILRPEQPNRT